MALSLRFPREFAINPFYRASSLAHHVPIATVRDNLYVLTDFSFAAVFRVQGLLYDLAGGRETVAFVDSLKSILNQLRPGMQLKVLHRIHHNYRNWLEEHLAQLDGDNVFARYVAWDQARMFHRMMEERQLLRSDNYVVITYKPRHQWWNNINLKDIGTAVLELTEKSPVVQKSLRQYRVLVLQFEDAVRQVAQQMNLAGLKPQRLTNEELYQLAWEILNPRLSLRMPCPKIRLPDPRDPYTGIFSKPELRKLLKKRPDFAFIAPLSEREQLCASDWVIRDQWVNIDGVYYGAITLRMLPMATYPGMAIQLAGIPFETTIAIDCVMLQKEKELEKQWAEARSALAKADATLFGGLPDPANQEKAREQMTSYMELSSAFENPFRMRMTIVVAAENPEELKQRCDAILTLLRNMDNAVGIRERFGVDTLIKTTWPFYPITDINTRKTITSHVAALLPIFSRWEGSKRPITLATDRLNRLVRIDSFPLYLNNKNRIICGRTGSGKSFATQLALVQPHAARKNTEILIVESGGSFELTTVCFGGVNIRLGPKSPYTINAWDLSPQFDQLSPDKQNEELQYKYNFLTRLVLAMADLPNAEQIKLAESVIGTVVQQTYQVTRHPRFRDFYRLLGKYSNPEDPEAEKMAARIRTLIRNYVIDESGRPGIYARYFDCDTNFDVNAPIITFDLIDIKDTLSLLVPMMMVTLMGLIYNRITSRDGKDRLIIVDEAWALLKDKPDGSPSPTGAAIELFWREGRKMGVSCTLITQNFSDIAFDKTGRAIVGNSTIHFLLSHESNEDNIRAFRASNMSQEKIDAVFDLKTQKGDYSEIAIREDEEFGVVRLLSTSLRYWLATTDPEDLKILNRYKQIYGEGYGLAPHEIVAILAANYPTGAYGEHHQEMTESEALVFVERFRDRLARFGELVRQGKPVPFDFE